jgi:exodeoxyribonuclease VII large subunit
MEKKNALSVSEINDFVKSIATTYLGNKIFVKGTISNVQKKGGNMFFSLKDNESNISAVYWKYGSNNFNNDDVVIIEGKITFYTKQGTYQITVSNIEKSEEENIESKYNKMKDEFEKKSYFSKKREFPVKIKNIGILTSIEGAALHDILYVLNNNNFCGNIYVKNCLAQGLGCPKSVKEGIEFFNKLNDTYPIDILVITRGGGSIDDLMGYSSEEVVKAIYDTNLFTISAIGHEIDTMLSDYAADYRAPTPSIAGEIITKYQKKEDEKLIKIMELVKTIEYSIVNKINNYKSQIEKYTNIYRIKSPENILNSHHENLDKIRKKIRDKIYYNIHNNNHELDKLKIKNNIHNTTKILKTGYVIITDTNDNLVENLSDFKNKIKEKNDLKIMFNDGEAKLFDLFVK